MTPDDWNGVDEARVPVSALPRLARLRDRSDVRVVSAGEVAWVRWEQSRAEVVRALLPVPGVVFYHTEDDQRFPFGSRLPTSDAPPPGEGRPLSSVLFPSAVLSVEPDAGSSPQVLLRLVRDNSPRPTAALVCPIASLRAWADVALTSELAAVSGLVAGGRAVLFGAKLPSLAEATRFHGTDVLAPLGFRLDPPLPSSVLRAAAGCERDEVLVISERGAERVPRDRAEPLTRAGVRLATGEEVA
jgi:hypothetical protein